MWKHQSEVYVSDTETSGTERPKTKRKNEDDNEEEESQGKRLAEWKEAAEADRENARLWKPFEITEEGQRQAEEALKTAIENYQQMIYSGEELNPDERLVLLNALSAMRKSCTDERARSATTLKKIVKHYQQRVDSGKELTSEEEQ